MDDAINKNSSVREKKYIIPPGLDLVVEEFEDHVKVAGDTPIIIVGPSGVGKTLFLNIFIRLYEEEFKERFIEEKCSNYLKQLIETLDNKLGEEEVKKKLKKYHQQQTRNYNKSPTIVWANCAHFGGQHSDPNIARSELFGHVKGSHVQAQKDKKGLVDTANGGVLILEEIGELPLEVQAMLLTFIETRKRRSLGNALVN